MKAGPAIWLPVVFGAAAGVLFAVAGVREPSPKVSAETPAISAATAPAAAPSTAVPPGPIPSLAEATGEPPATAGSAAPAAAEPSVAAGTTGAPAASAVEQGRPAPAFDLSIPASAEELYKIEVRCDRKSPEDCERTARTLDAGTFQPRDAKRAFNLRRVALTLYVKQCNLGRVLACARLREMYIDGEMVKASTVSANALRDRVAQLCAQKPKDPGCGS